MSEYVNMRTADIIVEALLDWNVNVMFGLADNNDLTFLQGITIRVVYMR